MSTDQGSANVWAAGTFARLARPALQTILDRLRNEGYRTIGPRIGDGAVIYDDLRSIDELPIGWLDRQDGGMYRLEANPENGYFDFVVGPHSLKNFLFRPRETLLEGLRADGAWQFRVPDAPIERLAVIGPRSCDLHALAVQDRVFLEGPYVDPAYQARRQGLFIVAVNCRRAAATCFCHSMKTGPAVSSGFDLALTEMDDAFVIEVGTPRGGEIISGIDAFPCSKEEIEAAREVPQQLERRMHERDNQAAATDGAPRGRHLDTHDIRDLLMSNLEHPRWHDVAARCLSCGNCTSVCPTCFCSSVEEVADLTGDAVKRERAWTSCFTAEHSYTSAGVVRQTTRSRYRQWLTHKLATWIDQFGTSGCVGCGRCITWCPVAIDLTEEVAAIRRDQP